MLRNYIVVAWRTLIRSKAFSAINIIGLSSGLFCCLLLALYILDDLKFDRHHQRIDDLYRLVTHFDVPRHGFDKIATVSPPIAPALKNEIPEVEAAARLFALSSNLFKYESKSFYENDGYVADSTIFEILTFEFLEGNPRNALAHANTVVITESLANKLFGKGHALNNLITISQDDANISFAVTGVIKDNPRTHLRVNYLISIASEGAAKFFSSDQANGEWAGMQFTNAYVKLSDGHNKEAVVAKANGVLLRHGMEDMKALGFTKKIDLQPVKEIYIKSDIQQTARIKYLYIIASIAVFVLLLACINFMNLSTARASRRAAEFGIRKAMGAYRTSLIGQIMGEAVVNVAISMLISITVVQLTLPLFNDFVGKSISVHGNIERIAPIIFLVALVTAIGSGSYPAFYFSAFQPWQVLKGRKEISNTSGRLRKILVVFQFVIAIVLICGMVAINRQMKYMDQKDLGFDANAKIVLPLRTPSAKAVYASLKNELRKLGSVRDLSGADYIPGSNIVRDMPFYAEGQSMDNSVPHKRNLVDHGFQELLGIKLIAGKPFSNNRELESQNRVILNMTSVQRLGLEMESAVGQKIYFEWQGVKHAMEIIGVMQDYHQASLKEAILPVLFEIPATDTEYDFLIASVDGQDFRKTVKLMEKTWNRLINDTPFEYTFLDDAVRQQYSGDRKLSGIVAFFTMVAMFISCLGLYGLSSYLAERRTKEIGIRKVLGANVTQIVSMMSTEFVKLIFVASLIAVPIGWYAMDQWLENFAYKTSIDAFIFLYAAVGALLIAVITVSFESIKAASSNPVNSLRDE